MTFGYRFDVLRIQWNGLSECWHDELAFRTTALSQGHPTIRESFWPDFFQIDVVFIRLRVIIGGYPGDVTALNVIVQADFVAEHGAAFIALHMVLVRKRDLDFNTKLLLQKTERNLSGLKLYEEYNLREISLSK